MCACVCVCVCVSQGLQTDLTQEAGILQLTLKPTRTTHTHTHTHRCTHWRNGGALRTRWADLEGLTMWVKALVLLRIRRSHEEGRGQLISVHERPASTGLLPTANQTCRLQRRHADTPALAGANELGHNTACRHYSARWAANEPARRSASMRGSPARARGTCVIGPRVSQRRGEATQMEHMATHPDLVGV